MADNMDAIPAVAPAVLLKEKGVKPPLPPPPAAQQAAAERAAAERAAAAAVVTTKERPGKPQDGLQTEGRDGEKLKDELYLVVPIFDPIVACFLRQAAVAKAAVQRPLQLQAPR